VVSERERHSDCIPSFSKAAVYGLRELIVPCMGELIGRLSTFITGSEPWMWQSIEELSFTCSSLYTAVAK